MRTIVLGAALFLVACGGDDGGSGAQDAGHDSPRDTGGSDTADAPPLDGAPNSVGCTTFAALNSAFTGTICGPWGAASGTLTVENVMDHLHITPSSVTTSDGTCTSNATAIIPDGGFFMEVPAPILQTAGYVTLRHTALDVAINSRDNKLRFTNAIGTVTVAQVPFVTGAMRWWRLRPDRVTNEIVGEYSADANAWYELGRVARTLNMSGVLVVSAGSESPTMTIDSADIDNLNVCP